MEKTQILLFTNNKNKIREFGQILSSMKELEVELLSLSDIGVSLDVEENGSTFEENALIKASAIKGYIVIADDSGLCVDALDGAPGVYSARFCDISGKPKREGESTDLANNRILLEMMKDTPKEKRSCRFVCAIACVFPDNESFTVRGECEGELLYSPSGTGGFGYDPLFFSKEKNASFAELFPEEKNEISHRRRALDLFAAEFQKRIKEKRKG